MNDKGGNATISAKLLILKDSTSNNSGRFIGDEGLAAFDGI
jgi:hypothetical protein